MDHHLPPPLQQPSSAITTPPLPQPPSHPSYADMITAAIVWDSTLGKGGSTKRSIANYIDRVYNIPPTHSNSALLTHHLLRLNSSGFLSRIKNSYHLSSSPSPASMPSNPNPKPYGAHSGEPRKRGRPPKSRIEVEIQHPSTGPVKRGPGRPPKQKEVVHVAVPQLEHGPGRPVKYNVRSVGVGGVGKVGKGVGRARGRQKRSLLGPGLGSIGKMPRGRPPLMVGASAGVVGVGGGNVGVGVKRRGRPPRGSGGQLKVRKLSGKPLGRPRKNFSLVNHTSGLGMANEDLRRRLEHIQSMVREAIDIIRPYVANENTALVALQQLTELVTPPAPPLPPPAPPLPPPAAPPVSATPMTAIPPPNVSQRVPLPVNVTMPLPHSGALPVPVMNAPFGPYSVNIPPMTVTAPFQATPSIGIQQQPLSWMTTPRESHP